MGWRTIARKKPWVSTSFWPWHIWWFGRACEERLEAISVIHLEQCLHCWIDLKERLPENISVWWQLRFPGAFRSKNAIDNQKFVGKISANYWKSNPLKFSFSTAIIAIFLHRISAEPSLSPTEITPIKPGKPFLLWHGWLHKSLGEGAAAVITVAVTYKVAIVDDEIGFCMGSKTTGWWFGTFLFFNILGIVTPTDFHIFQRGGSTTNPTI